MWTLVDIYVSALRVNLAQPTLRRFHLRTGLVLLRDADVQPSLTPSTTPSCFLFEEVDGSELHVRVCFTQELAAAARSCFLVGHERKRSNGGENKSVAPPLLPPP